MNRKRAFIEEHNPSFETLPDATDLYACLPQNRWLCRGKDRNGRLVDLYCFGQARNRRDMTLQTFVDAMLYQVELRNVISDICSAFEGRTMERCHLFDFTQGSLAGALELIDFARAEANASASIAPSPDQLVILCNFPVWWDTAMRAFKMATKPHAVLHVFTPTHRLTEEKVFIDNLNFERKSLAGKSLCEIGNVTHTILTRSPAQSTRGRKDHRR